MGQDAMMVFFSESDTRNQQPHITIILLLNFTVWSCTSLSVSLGQVDASWLHEKIVVTYLNSRL